MLDPRSHFEETTSNNHKPTTDRSLPVLEPGQNKKKVRKFLSTLNKVPDLVKTFENAKYQALTVNTLQYLVQYSSPCTWSYQYYFGFCIVALTLCCFGNMMEQIQSKNMFPESLSILDTTSLVACSWIIKRGSLKDTVSQLRGV